MNKVPRPFPVRGQYQDLWADCSTLDENEVLHLVFSVPHRAPMPLWTCMILPQLWIILTLLDQRIRSRVEFHRGN